MAIDRAALLATSVDDEPVRYAERDCILYALGIGFAVDGDPRELPYVYEGVAMHTVPTMANRFLDSGFIADCGWDYRRLVHVGERLELYRPLPPAAELLANRRVSAVDDLGEGKGVVIGIETELRQRRDDTVLATCGRTYLARGDGGERSSTPMPVRVHDLPGRAPDLDCSFRTRPNQALLFRLVDSMNPIHADAAAARAAGFERPVLQGRCTFGIACHAILKTICDYDFTLIAGFEARFSAPVYPGEEITTDMWQDGNVVSFRCRVADRDSVVLDHGHCRLRA